MRIFTVFILIILNIVALNCFAEDLDSDQHPKTITAAEMEKRLNENADAALYLQLDEDKALVYQNTASDRSLRKQLILNAPTDKINRLYTNDKETFKQMTKMLKDYEESNADFGGYRIMTDTDLTKSTDDGVKIYRFWFMKLAREEHESRLPIGIGIGIGGGHNRPWIGIGL